MVWEDSTAFVSVSVWILSGVQEALGYCFWCKKRWGSSVKCRKDLQERPPPPQIPKRSVLELIKVLFPSGESLLYPYRAPPPQKAGFPGYRGDLNGVRPPCDGSRSFLRGGREKPSSHRPRVTRSPRPYRVLKPASQGAQPAAAVGGAWRGSWAPGAD